MPRVIGIDPGTVSIDICGLDDGRLFLDESFPTAEALARPEALAARLERAGALDLVAGPSGYGLPLVNARDASDADLRLAFLASEGESGGIGGLRALTRVLAGVGLPVVLTPGVVHLPSVPRHRKVNRVDMGTADKVCAAALAIREQSEREGCAAGDVALIMVELGGAFTAALAVEDGRVVDGVGGSSGPLGVRASGALDGEVAFLAGVVSKAMVFRGGAADVAGRPDATPEELAADRSPRGAAAWEAYLEGAVKAVAALAVSAPRARAVVLSGRVAAVPGVCEALAERLRRVVAAAPVRRLAGFARVAKHAAQGAALVADGLAGGASAALVAAMQIRGAAGTALDHLHVVSPAEARGRLGLA